MVAAKVVPWPVLSRRRSALRRLGHRPRPKRSGSGRGTWCARVGIEHRRRLPGKLPQQSPHKSRSLFDGLDALEMDRLQARHDGRAGPRQFRNRVSLPLVGQAPLPAPSGRRSGAGQASARGRETSARAAADARSKTLAEHRRAPLDRRRRPTLPATAATSAPWRARQAAASARSASGADGTTISGGPSSSPATTSDGNRSTIAAAARGKCHAT